MCHIYQQIQSLSNSGTAAFILLNPTHWNMYITFLQIAFYSTSNLQLCYVSDLKVRGTSSVKQQLLH